MRLFQQVVIALALAPLAAMSSARAQDAGNPTMYTVNYIEATPAARTAVVAMLKQLADASRKETGALRFEVLQRLVPSHHFAILEVWKDQQALDAHTGA